ncbi:Hsp20/alpha crystallin family protein [Aureispira sp. CCB-E]|uniref:Hsp20/alpha crystallin family protein n=1 Tax=Aureispira sp. CCB-E TaxID=3051121 RepID=UPI002868A18E|nr:Hsp20/alpha crystallin family protein [Aureispira sp. CCB-E]WMX15956.1 Hsp20/alpha crystallin family protein [Aureispira sp. CCB-E]
MLPVKSNLLPTVSKFFDDDWNSLFNWSNRNFANNRNTLPSVNIKETTDEYCVEVAAPGMKKEDFHIELDNNTLTIKSEVEHENEATEGENFTRKEFCYQSFQRSFNLNNRVVDDSNIKATYQDGILSLTLPKKEEAKKKPARQIEIS